MCGSAIRGFVLILTDRGYMQPILPYLTIGITESIGQDTLDHLLRLLTSLCLIVGGPARFHVLLQHHSSQLTQAQLETRVHGELGQVDAIS